MNRRRIAMPTVAAALIGSGVVGDRARDARPAQPAAAAPTAAPATTPAGATPATDGTRPAATAAGIDAVIERAFALASRSVVYVNNVGVGSGSGVIYDPSGDIVTNAHVVVGA